jgi:hypothetical protein
LGKHNPKSNAVILSEAKDLRFHTAVILSEAKDLRLLRQTPGASGLSHLRTWESTNLQRAKSEQLAPPQVAGCPRFLAFGDLAKHEPQPATPKAVGRTAGASANFTSK